MKNICLTICCGLGLLFADITPAHANEAADLTAFDSAVAIGDRSGAARAYGRLYMARLPKDGKPFADATLDALAGRIHLLVGEPDYARAWLRKPDAGDRSNRTERLIAAAEAELLTGHYAEAAAVAARAVTLLTGDGQTRALILQAHALVMTDPAAARALIAGRSSPSPSLGWRLAFLDAITAQLTGDAAAARAAADRAQLLANGAPTRDYAPRQTLKLHAGLAAAQGQRERTMVTLGALNQSADAPTQYVHDIVNWLPLCGFEGLRADDELIVSLTTLSVPTFAMAVPVAASRPDIVAPFMRALAGYQVTSQAVPAFGPESLLTLRCAAADQSRAAGPFNEAAFADTFASANIRPRFLGWERFEEADPLKAVSRGVDEIQAIVGQNSPLLILPLYEQLNFTMEVFGRDQSAAVFERALAIAKRKDALQAPYGLAERTLPLFKPGLTYNQRLQALRTLVETKHVDIGYMIGTAFLFDGNRDARDRLAIAELMLTRMASIPRDGRYQTLLLLKLALLREVAGGAEVERFARTAALDPALCPVQAVTPRVFENGVSANDFPVDAITAQIGGLSILAIDVDAAGKVTRARPLVESPALAFRPTNEAAITRMKFAPARSAAGKAVACTGLRQPIRWALP